MKYRLTFILLLFLLTLKSQPDSLITGLQKASSKDSARILNKLSIFFRFSEGDLALKYAQLALNNAERNKNILEQANANNAIGVQMHLLARYVVAMEHYLKAVKLFESINEPRGLASANLNMGIVHSDQGRFKEAITYYEYAAEKYKMANHPRGVAAAYNNLATVFSSMKDPIKAQEYHSRALKIRVELKDSAGIASSYGGLGVAYSDQKNYFQSIQMQQKALEIQTRLMDKKAMAIALNNIGVAYTGLGDVKNAEKNYLNGIAVAEETKNYFSLVDLYENLTLLYEKKNDFKSAHDYQKKYISAKDTMFNVQSSDKLTEMESKYQNDKKQLEIDNLSKTQKVQELELENKQKESTAKNKILVLGAIAFLGIAVFAFFAFNNFKKTQRANIIINSQKEQVELQNQEISHQKELVEEKQKEIIDSINYAQKIQSAVLTSEDVWKKISPEHFIIFFPKDIVSGDFYWAYNTTNNRSVFALADCTGHGVPGGFMSMLGNSFLNELVVENKLFKADAILNKLREKIIKALGQKGADDRKDGMDMGLCVWNKLENTLEFSGANNNLWLIRNNELVQYQGNKMPIGQFSGELNLFTSHTVNLQKNDLIVMCTDGFADQFGGESGKKLKSKNLKEFLVKGANHPLPQQKSELITLFTEWKGNHQQVDDVSLIMIKVV